MERIEKRISELEDRIIEITQFRKIEKTVGKNEQKLKDLWYITKDLLLCYWILEAKENKGRAENYSDNDCKLLHRHKGDRGLGITATSLSLCQCSVWPHPGVHINSNRLAAEILN